MSASEFDTWKSRLDRLCARMYCVSTHDMGFDNAELQRFWSDGDTEQDTADYFGSKFNLTLVEEINWGKPFD